MLEDIRESSQGMIAKVILGLIILTFAVAGIGSYTNSVDTSVAEVNGEKISQQDFNKAYQNQRSRMQQQFGEMFETLSSDENYMANFRQGVLDSLINEKLIDQSSRNLAIRVSDERIKKTIREMPEFQVDGKFDNNRYLALIQQAGFYQSSNFRDYLRVEMTRRQLSQALVASEFSLPYQEKLQSALQNQTRDIRFAVIASEQFKENIEVTADEINNYYLANQVRFENKEQVKVDYITLDVADIAKTIEVTDADVEAYYKENSDSFRQAEQRKVAHILIEFADDEATAKTKIEAIKARLAQGEDFSALAKELSDDVFSGENGGDLDWLEPGAMEESFEQAALALTEVGSISDIVKTSFGYHIIKLTDKKAEVVKSLAEVRDELFTKISQEKAQDKFFELQQEMARISFEFPDSLDDVAAEINGKVQTSPWLSRGVNATPFDQPKVIEAAFSDLVLQDNMNSDVIEVTDSMVMVLRLNTYQEAKVKPLAEVTAQITASLINEKATTKAQNTVDELLIQFKAGHDITEQLAALNAKFEEKAKVKRYASDVDQSIVRKAFVLPHPVEGEVSAASVALSNGDLALVEVKAVSVADVPVDPSLAKQQTSQLAQSAYKSYVDTLKSEAKIIRRELAAPVSAY